MVAAGRATLDAFESAVTRAPNIVTAQGLFGDPDYLLRIVSADLAAFQTLYDAELGHKKPGAAAMIALASANVDS